MRSDFLKIEDSEGQLQFLQSLSYPVIFRYRTPSYYLSIPQLGLIAKSDSIELAQKELEDKKNTYFRSMIEANAAMEIVFPDNRLDLIDQKKNIIKVFIRSSLIFAFCIFTAYATAKTFSNTLNKGFDKLSVKLDTILNVDESRKEQRLLRFRENLKSVKPYIDEIKGIL